MYCCDVCGAKVSEVRRGRCWGCYGRWVEARPVGIGARCVTCGDRRRRLLKTVELYGVWQPMCFSCSGQVLTLDPMPTSIAALKTAISRERRARDRRFGKVDSRVFQYERRVGERREERAPGCQPIDDGMILEVVIEPTSGSVDIDFDDMTQIRDLPTL
ncbi:MAG: hypothetical protein R2939_17595 [Kofleriaceae bacterium]